jgi:citrate synthase
MLLPSVMAGRMSLVLLSTCKSLPLESFADPNVDFWSGLIYRAMGFPTDFFPVLFAVPRVVGWLAHWRQMMLQKGGLKIWSVGLSRTLA